MKAAEFNRRLQAQMRAAFLANSASIAPPRAFQITYLDGGRRVVIR